MKAKGQLNVLIPNLLASLREKDAKLPKKYTPGAENILLTTGAVSLFLFDSLQERLIALWIANREEGSDTSASYV